MASYQTAQNDQILNEEMYEEMHEEMHQEVHEEVNDGVNEKKGPTTSTSLMLAIIASSGRRQ